VTGDVSFAEEPAQVSIEMQPEAPKPAHVEIDSETAIVRDLAGSVIVLAEKTEETTAAGSAGRAGDGLVIVRAKPEKRKNYKERAQEKFAQEKFAKANFAKDGTTPDTTATAKSEAKTKAKTDAKAVAKAKAKLERKKVKAERQKAKRTKAAA
jgi:hypothetical protein